MAVDETATAATTEVPSSSSSSWFNPAAATASPMRWPSTRSRIAAAAAAASSSSSGEKPHEEEKIEGRGGADDARLPARGPEWLYWNWFNSRPSILADEMGLGKTIQTIGFFHRLRNARETKLRGPFSSWRRSRSCTSGRMRSACGAPDMNCIVYHGDAVARGMMQEHDFWYRTPHVPADEAAKLKRRMW